LKKVKRLVIVPDGMLFEVPFEVLLRDDPAANDGWGDMPYLGHSYATLYAPSASVYLKLLQTEEKRKYPIDLIAMGDPDFSLFDDDAGQGAALLPLPHTKLEIEHISSRVKEKRRSVYLGADANEYALKMKLGETESRIVHLATHGLVDPVEPISSSVVLCPDERGHDDGFLYTLEILSMPFDVGLVVVSACESGAGRISRSEGVVGLSRAFLASGAGGVVASLWAVSDESTAALMKKFYERMMGKKKPAAEALKDARITLTKDERYAHPFYWSAFIVIGHEKAPW
jgi:CHAT domain-containing protein